MNLTTEKIIETQSIETVSAVFGAYDAYIKIIENHFNVQVLHRENVLKISGNEESTGQTDSNYVRQVREWRQQN